MSKTIVDISKKDNYKGKKEGNVNYIMSAIRLRYAVGTLMLIPLIDIFTNILLFLLVSY